MTATLAGSAAEKGLGSNTRAVWISDTDYVHDENVWHRFFDNQFSRNFTCVGYVFAREPIQ